MSLADLREAAEARRAQMRAAVDRPSQRRCADDPSAPARALLRAAPMQIRSQGGAGQGFHGLASRTDTPYEMWDMFGPYSEVVRAGAFATTLAAPNLDVPLVLDHVRSQVFASTVSEAHPLALAETADGLEADAPTPDWSGFDWLPGKIASGLITEMSFRFSIVRGQWSPDWMEYYIEEVDINRGDVAIVGYGANPYTAAELRRKPDLGGLRGPDLADRTDAFVLAEFVRLRAECRQRGLKLPMSQEDVLRAS